MILDGDAAVEKDVGVRGGVVEPVELPELLPGQVRDRLGIAPGIVSVGVIGEKILLEGLVHEPLGRRVGPLHLVVDDARNGEIARRVGRVDELEVMPLLQEGLPEDSRPEDQVGVHPGKVEVVHGHLAGHGVDGLVGVGKGVDEGLECGPRQLVEGILHGVGLGAGEDRVLQDVGDPRRVPGRRAESDGEEVFAVIGVKVENPRPCGEVLHLVSRAAQIADGLDPPDKVASQGLARPASRGRARCRFIHAHLVAVRLHRRRLRLGKRYWKYGEESRFSLRTGPSRRAKRAANRQGRRERISY